MALNIAFFFAGKGARKLASPAGGYYSVNIRVGEKGHNPVKSVRVNWIVTNGWWCRAATSTRWISIVDAFQRWARRPGQFFHFGLRTSTV